MKSQKQRQAKQLDNYKYMAGAGGGILFASFLSMMFNPSFLLVIVGLILLVGAGLFIYFND